MLSPFSRFRRHLYVSAGNRALKYVSVCVCVYFNGVVCLYRFRPGGLRAQRREVLRRLAMHASATRYTKDSSSRQ